MDGIDKTTKGPWMPALTKEGKHKIVAPTILDCGCLDYYNGVIVTGEIENFLDASLICIAVNKYRE